MRFLIGDKVKHVTRGREGVVEAFKNETLALVNFGNGPEVASFTNLVLLDKGTDVQQLRRSDPEALEAIVPFVRRIEISCSPNAVDVLCSEMSSLVSGLTETDAVDYVRVVTDRSHGAKFDTIIEDKLPADLSERLRSLFKKDGHRAKTGELQSGSRPLAEWLMTAHNILPEKALVNED